MMKAKPWILPAAAVPLALGAILFLVTAVHRLFVPYELDYGEGIVMWQVSHVVSLAKAYHPISQAPYIVFHYTPVYQLASWALGRLIHDPQVAGRTVSLLGCVGTAVAIAFLVARTAPRPMARAARVALGAAAALLALNVGTIQGWVPMLRVDLLALCFTFWGLALFAGGRPTSAGYWAFGCFVAAVFTKQTMIAAPLACTIVGMIRDGRRTARHLGLAVVLGGVVTIVLEAVTHGQFLRHTFAYNQNPFSPGQARHMLGANLLSMVPLLAIALVAIGVAIAPAGRGRRAWSALVRGSRWRRAVLTVGLTLLFSLGISIGVGKIGANVNYFLEWNLACVVLAGLTAGWVLMLRRTARNVSVAAAVLVAVWGYVLPRLPAEANNALQLTAGARQLSAATRTDYEKLLAAVEAIPPGPIVSYEMTVLVKAGREIPIEPGIMFTLARAGVWDETPFVRELDQGKYVALILPSSIQDDRLMTDPIQEAMTQGYRETARIGAFHIYKRLRDHRGDDGQR